MRYDIGMLAMLVQRSQAAMHSGMPSSSFTLVSAHQQIQFIMQAKLDHLQRTALLSDMARVGTPTLHSAESVHRRTVLHSLVVAVARSTRVRAVRTVPAQGTGPDRLRYCEWPVRTVVSVDSSLVVSTS